MEIDFNALLAPALEPIYRAKAIIICIFALKLVYLTWQKCLNQEERDLIKAWLRLPF